MKKFQLNEIVFVSIIVATVFVIGYTLIPLMQMLPLPAYKAIVVAPIYSIAVTLIYNKIQKNGLITLLGLLLGIILSMFTVFMLIIASLGGVITDVVATVLRKKLELKYVVPIAGGLFPAIQIPITFIVMAYAVGGVFGELLSRPLIIFIPAIVTFAIGYLTSNAIQRLIDKRRILRTDVIKPEDEK